MIEQIFEWLQDGSIVRDTFDLWTFLAQIAVTLLLIILVQWLLPWLSDRFPEYRLRFLATVPPLRLFILMAGIFIISLGIFGRERMLTLSLFLAVGVGFAFRDYVSSIIAGIVAVYERPYQPGDWVSIDGDYGTIRAMGLRSIKIVTPDDSIITIPHSKIWNQNISNANSGQNEHMVVANFFVNQEHDADRVRQVLWDIGITSPYVHLGRDVTVIVLEKPWATQYRLKAYPIDGRDEFQFISDLTVRGKAALKDLNVSMASMPPLWQEEG